MLDWNGRGNLQCAPGVDMPGLTGCHSGCSMHSRSLVVGTPRSSPDVATGQGFKLQPDYSRRLSSKHRKFPESMTLSLSLWRAPPNPRARTSRLARSFTLSGFRMQTIDPRCLVSNTKRPPRGIQHAGLGSPTSSPAGQGIIGFRAEVFVLCRDVV
ncbi:hypothetical protein BO70DRAFT_20393 [Aspergillus heteromorphus CBS 117.55]|uniref:Uncharacterized protein n=1 Tax=Aspergillus heteromorphus CBS 117.55 TaxID=1448321 RepID=A0A317X2S5_9EURO|nr:uncharacterized protein BO70DRAFT_20393 [Aspergillus heteromorphus CBS 117.55]PWY92853.1 hypothetical protein BO70DRAFT_20393 [Aspergillus heteromorphus CBS 117.55]